MKTVLAAYAEFVIGNYMLISVSLILGCKLHSIDLLIAFIPVYFSLYFRF